MPRVLVLSNPRSGSTYLMNLLNSHPEVQITEEILEEQIPNNPIVYVEGILSTFPTTFVGFKLFPSQIFQQNLRFDDLVSKLGVEFVIIIWRENMLDTFTSLQIAHRTGVWFDTKEATKLETVAITTQEFTNYVDMRRLEWQKIGEQWPTSGQVKSIFVRYEDLAGNASQQMRIIMSQLGFVTNGMKFTSPGRRQNPAKIQDKVITWNEIPEELRNLKLDVFQILSKSKGAGNGLFQIPPEIAACVPDREPTMPPGGWRYNVADPFMSNQMKQNVFDAVESGSVSSAGYWPRQLSSKLKQLFRVPVAQPCNNGFTALMLAMQAVKLEADDQVILPSLTMIAVANAVHFVRAKPVFADSDINNYNPSWSQILEVATEKTKMVIVTHTYGVPCPDIERIAKECSERSWWLLEDISEAVGVQMMTSSGELKLLGTFGHFAIASMYVNKMVHAGDGGFVIAQNSTYGPRLLSLVNHGFTPSYHFVHFEPAINAKMNGLGAAMACGCLDEIQAIMQHRTKLASLYRKALKNVPVKLIPVCGPFDTPWVFGLECQSKKERTELRHFLAQNGVETRDYFFPIHLQPAFLKIKYALPNAEHWGSTGFYLPTHSNLTKEDIDFMAGVVIAYFSMALVTISPPMAKPKTTIQIKPGNFHVQMRNFIADEAVHCKNVRGHAYYQAVKLGLRADEIITNDERWDDRYILVQDIQECIKLAREEGLTSVETFFEPYTAYLKSQMTFEPAVVKPWLLVDLASAEFAEAANISGTTDTETLQVLVWLIQSGKIATVWEIGCWFGKASYLMAAAGQQVKMNLKIFSCDAFKWQSWMSARALDPSLIMQPFDSFKGQFLKHIERFSDVIEAVDWPYDITELPANLQDHKPSLIFIDITQDAEELEAVWKLIYPALVVNETIVVVNGMLSTSIPFFTKHADELVAIAKPSTLAKVFRFVSGPIEKPHVLPLNTRMLNFQSDPAWDHHHKHLFGSVIQKFKEKHHNPHADVQFIPAVEDYMTENLESLLSGPWIGVIHSVADHPDLQYTPDLRRLCSRRYLNAMKNCRGLYTLTRFQADFLKKHLSQEICIPIQPLVYPVDISAYINQVSTVPSLWKAGCKVDLIHIGSFARDYKFFFNADIPENLHKVLLIGDDSSKDAAEHAPSGVVKLERLSAREYEAALTSSVVFLSLKYDGAANTIVVECIARNVPIVAPAMDACVEYLGSDYPLLYNPACPDFHRLITLENVQRAVEYLRNKNKSQFHVDHFMASIESGAVMLSVPSKDETMNFVENFGLQTFRNHYDVTISLCSYKRTHNLPAILRSLWEGQDFPGKIQIIVWNNNYNREFVVRQMCNSYVQASSGSKSCELISSTENYYCSVRLAMPLLMRSDVLLICDDDIIPGPNYISFFMDAHRRAPRDVLCVRGHVFSEHELQVEDPTNVWHNYDNLRFYSDETPERFIHFVHADACLIPRDALQECASVPMPDRSFVLVDDYWMSYVLNHKFGRKLRKLCLANLITSPLVRTDDSDTVGLALHTRPEVDEARMSFYIYHMTHGWPAWSRQQPEIDLAVLKIQKTTFWDRPFIGFNVSSKIDEVDISDLVRAGVTCVRIGAVGVGKNYDFDLSQFLVDGEQECKRLEKTVALLEKANIKVVLSLDRRLALSEIWNEIAAFFTSNPNIVGYDLINEPFTATENDMHWASVESAEDKDLPHTILTYTKLIGAIRANDPATPIIIESTFWAHIHALGKLPMSHLAQIDSNIIVSVHFYEPQSLTYRRENKGRFTFPGSVPVYDDIKYSEIVFWDDNHVASRLSKALQWGKANKVKVVLGEFGICREVPGAAEYLRCIMEFCRGVGMSAFLFSFRDDDWDAMNYELGSDLQQVVVPGQWNDNPLMQTILRGIAAMKHNKPSQLIELFTNF